MSNELNEKEQAIIASKRREEALAAVLASKEKIFEQDASARVQLGQKMQALFIEKEDALEQVEYYKVCIALICVFVLLSFMILSVYFVSFLGII
jgi:hypothetical protein